MKGTVPEVSIVNLNQEAGIAPTDPDQTWEDEPFDGDVEVFSDPANINDGEPVAERGDE